MEAESDSRDVVDTVSAPVDAAGGEEEAVSPAAVAEETTPVEPPLAEPATAATAEAAAEVPTAEEVPAAAEPVEEESDAAPGEAATPVTEVPEDVTADAQAPPAPAAAPAPAPAAAPAPAPAPAAAPAPAPAAAPAPAPPAAAAAAPPTEVVEETATTAEVAAAAPAPDVVSPVHPNTDGASDVVHVSVDKGGSSDDRVTQSDRGLADDDAAEALPTETVTGDAAAAVDGAPPPPPSGGAAAPVVDAAVPKSADAPAPTREPHSASQQQQQQRRPESPAPQQQQQQQQHPHRVAAVLHRVGSPSATSAMPPYTSVAAAADGAYDMSEADRIAVAAASLTPNTALSIFRRGRENSHVNRMEIGSYSRYLLSTDHMPPVVLDSTFHGEEPTVGAVPRNTFNASGRGHVGGGHTTADGAVGATTATLDREQVSPRAATASSSVRRSYHSPRPTSAATAASRAADQAVSGTFAGTAASSTNLRRELAMLGDVHLSDLNTTRQLRRRDPRHGKSAEEQHDHIYYNHHSKGYYVPHDPPADTTMLRYNHLYAFGVGTRFTAASNGASTNTATTTITHSHHPRAAPPRSFAETRGSAFPFTATQRQLYGTHHVGGGAAAAATATQRSRAATSASSALGGRGAPAITGSSSLRTAKAVDLNRLHTTQCSRPRSIEEVMADQPQRYLCGPDGVRGPLVHDIERDVEDGKLEWGDVPPAMRKAMAAATTAATAAAHRIQPTSAAGLPASASSAAGRRQQRGGSLSMAPNALGSVMGQVRTVSAIAAATGGVPATRGGAAAAKTLTTAPPSPEAAAAAAAARSPSAERGGGSATGAARRVPAGSSTAAAALPAISRLAYTPRPTPRSNPSAFV